MYSCKLPSSKMLAASDRDFRNSQDSAVETSLTQTSQHSELSLNATQDMFSQNSSGLQSEYNLQGNKKTDLYEKYWNKRSTFKQDLLHSATQEMRSKVQGMPTNMSNNALCTPCPHSMGFSNVSVNGPTKDAAYLSLKLHEHKMKTVGQNERDLEQMTSTIQDCSSEVKSTVLALKEKIETMTEASNEQLAQTMTSFLEDIWKHQEKMQQLIEDQQKDRISMTEMELKLSKKDSEITKLEEQLSETKNAATTHFVNAVSCEIQPPLLTVQNKLEEIISMARDTSEQHCRYFSELKQEIRSQKKQFSNLNRLRRNNALETEKRILSELKKAHNKSETSHYKAVLELKGEVSTVLESCVEQIKKAMTQLTEWLVRQIMVDFDKVNQQTNNTVLGLIQNQSEQISQQLEGFTVSQLGKCLEQLAYVQSMLNDTTLQMRDVLKTSNVHFLGFSEFRSQIDNRLSTLQSSLKHFVEMNNCCSENESTTLNDVKKCYPKSFLEGLADCNLTQFTECTKSSKETCAESRKNSPLSNNQQRLSFSLANLLQADKNEDNHCKLPSTDRFQNDGQKSPAAIISHNCMADFENSSEHFQSSTESIMKNKAPLSAYHEKRLFNTMFKENGKQNSAENISRTIFSQHKTAVMSRSGLSPVATVRPQRHKPNNPECPVLKNNSIQKQQKTRKCKKNVNNLMYSKKRQTTQNKNLLIEMDMMYTQTTHSSHNAKLNHCSNKGCVTFEKQLKRKTSSSDKINVLRNLSVTKDDCMKYTSEKRSSAERKGLDVCSSKELLSRKRQNESYSNTGHLSLASFISSRLTGQNASDPAETSTASSSPCISITKMAVRRNRTPFRKSLVRGTDCYTKAGDASPAPTLLSEISGMKNK